MLKSDWVRSMRIKRGLKGFQLAERLQVSAARVSMLEKDEMRGAVTLKMMAKAAQAMGCRFEYRIVLLSSRESEAISADNESQLPAKKPRYRVVPE